MKIKQAELGNIDVNVAAILHEARETTKLSTTIVGTDGKELCDFDYSTDGCILAVRPRPYQNATGLAENASEIVYCTDNQGRITEDRMTRKEVREQGRRYLVVTGLVYHGNLLLLQKRSADKELDPAMFSASAHGVAKELCFKNGGARMRNIQYVSLVNLALEMNEELRHGKDVTPLVVRFWSDDESSLFAYAREKSFNNPNEVWVVHPDLYQDAGYPLMSNTKPRTRLVANAHFFSEQSPPISFDPAETEKVEWVRASSIARSQSVTPDTDQAIDEVTAGVLERSADAGALGSLLVKKSLEKLFKPRS